MSVIKARKSQLYYPVCSKEGSTKYDPKKTEKKEKKKGLKLVRGFSWKNCLGHSS